MTNKIVVDCSTGEVQEIALTEDELAEREAMAIAYAEQKAEEDADKATKATAKAALLTKLGITEEEASLLLS
jgi:hypothetical protein